MKLKTIPAEKDKKNNCICLGCIGNESDSMCLEISEKAEEQNLRPCVKGFVYVEDENDN